MNNQRHKDIAKAVERLLEIKGWTEAGGGGDFTMYIAPSAKQSQQFVYLFDDGSWRFHDFSKWTNYEPIAQGEGADDLTMFLETLK